MQAILTVQIVMPLPYLVAWRSSFVVSSRDCLRADCILLDDRCPNGRARQQKPTVVHAVLTRCVLDRVLGRAQGRVLDRALGRMLGG